MARVRVRDCHGVELSPCSAEKADRLVAEHRAERVSREPPVIRLCYAVKLPEHPEPARDAREGQRVLLHVCCAPCATYTTARLRETGWQVVAHWFNPNIHPFGEHERRRESLAEFAAQVDLPVIWETGYDLLLFLRAVSGKEQFRERCLICYRLRLERTARVAAAEGFDALTTTLLISPYQDQAAIRDIGEELAQRHGLTFYYESFRRGFAAHHRLAREHGLYQQRYCGCIYSEWESQDRRASTHPRA